MSTPAVAIILPFRDAAPSLGLAVASILAQTFEDYALILVDDGSRDGSRSVAEGFDDPRITLLAHDQPRGLPARLNQALDHVANAVCSPLVARMDADDVAHPERLARQVALMESDRRLDLVGTGAVVVDSFHRIVGCRRPPTSHEEICATPYRRFPLSHPTWLGRLEWFRTHRYDELATRSQDYHLLREAFPTSRFGNVPDLLLAYDESRRHLRKAIGSRVACTRSLWRRGVPPREIVPALIGSAGLMAGAISDIAVNLTGRPDLAGLRLAPVSDAERREWRELLDSLRRRASGADARSHPVASLS